jgi:hypothetical protein
MKITDDQLKEVVPLATSMRDVMRKLGLKQAGGTQSHYTRRINSLGIDTSHFTGKSSNKGNSSNMKKTPEEILVLRKEGSRQKSKLLTRALLETGIPHECNKCGQEPSWLGNPLTLDVDHVNENWLDDRKENLRFLCPNCHSQFSRKLLGC